MVRFLNNQRRGAYAVPFVDAPSEYLNRICRAAFDVSRHTGSIIASFSCHYRSVVAMCTIPWLCCLLCHVPLCSIPTTPRVGERAVYMQAPDICTSPFLQTSMFARISKDPTSDLRADCTCGDEPMYRIYLRVQVAVQVAVHRAPLIHNHSPQPDSPAHHQTTSSLSTRSTSVCADTMCPDSTELATARSPVSRRMSCAVSPAR